VTDGSKISLPLLMNPLVIEGARTWKGIWRFKKPLKENQYEKGK
jgi:hypothetical protein